MADPIQNLLDDNFASCVVASTEIARSIFFFSYEVARIIELSIGAFFDLIDDSGFKVNEDRARNAFSCCSL